MPEVREEGERMTDNVNSPEHYTSGGIECIDAIRAALTSEEYRGYLKGNITKYIWRERLKGGAEDIAKAAWYIEELKKVDNANGNIERN